MHHPDKFLPLTSFPPPSTQDQPPPSSTLTPADFCRSSPPPPASPAPAYTALPYRDVDFHLAPLLNGRVGEIELETTDGKKFLVHKKVLETETVFFHIYYGFIPVWRLQSNGAGPPHPALPSHPPPPISPVSSGMSMATGAINNLFCLPKILASHLRNVPTQPRQHSSSDATPLLSDSDNYDVPPAVPPKDVTAPTPTSTPYTWVVPESSAVLAVFLNLIYPRGTFVSTPEDALSSIDMTAAVIRASMGYQSSKALNIARDRLSYWIPTHPVEVYSASCFFKFTDLARLSSTYAMVIPMSEWSNTSKAMMGRNGLKSLRDLRLGRLTALKEILEMEMEKDDHSSGCCKSGMIRDLWTQRCAGVSEGLRPESELLELLEVDLRGGHCGDCLVLLGMTIQRAILAAKELPRSV